MATAGGPGGCEPHREGVRTHVLADAWLKKMDTEAYAGLHIDPRRGDRPFSKVADAWRVSWIGLEPGAQAGYESILTHHLLPRSAPRGSPPLPRKPSSATSPPSPGREPRRDRAGIHAALRACLNTAVRLRMIPMNPAVGVKLPRAVKRDMVILTPEEIAGSWRTTRLSRRTTACGPTRRIHRTPRRRATGPARPRHRPPTQPHHGPTRPQGPDGSPAPATRAPAHIRPNQDPRHPHGVPPQEPRRGASPAPEA